MKAKKFDVISPDGFSIHYSDTYKSKKAAETALKNWCKAYERQGYYSSMRGRIELINLPYYCKIVEC